MFTLVCLIVCVGLCGMTVYDACSNFEPSVSIAEYHSETIPDIYDV